MTESYPDDNPKTQFGVKKTPMHLVPPAAIRGLAEAFANGAEKYGPFNWREKKISSTVYYAAAMRHLTDWFDRVDPDDKAPDSGVHHLKHAMACLALILDTVDTPLLNDNRPISIARPQTPPAPVAESPGYYPWDDAPDGKDGDVWHAPHGTYVRADGKWWVARL